MEYLSPKFSYICLQNEIRDSDRHVLNENDSILDVSIELNDFEDTAALIESLDLVISVDTSVAHLSGALQKSTWLLLSHVPDWRWMLNRKDSPWYSSLRLFRQSALGDWSGVLKEMKFELERFE